jgi:hypothetical protein
MSKEVGIGCSPLFNICYKGAYLLYSSILEFSALSLILIDKSRSIIVTFKSLGLTNLTIII